MFSMNTFEYIWIHLTTFDYIWLDLFFPLALLLSLRSLLFIDSATNNAASLATGATIHSIFTVVVNLEYDIHNPRYSKKFVYLLPNHLSFCLSVSLSLWLSDRPPICLNICLSDCLSLWLTPYPCRWTSMLPTPPQGGMWGSGYAPCTLTALRTRCSSRCLPALLLLTLLLLVSFMSYVSYVSLLSLMSFLLVVSLVSLVSSVSFISHLCHLYH